jgi:MFS family permease
MEVFFTVYARDVLGLKVGSATQMLTAFAAALILFAIPSGLIATRLGRRPTILAGIAGMVAGLIAGSFVRQPTILLVILGVMGAFWALININSLPMVYDLAGDQTIGSSTGLYYFASSAAAIGGPILAGRLIDLTSRSSIWLFSAFFLLLSGVCMLLVRAKPRPA